LDETGAEESRAGQALARLPSKPSGSYRRNGFLHGSNDHVRRALLLLIISHDRRRILHVNVTKHPTSGWIIQQLREAFPFGSAPRFLIFDRDAKYGFGGTRDRSIPEDMPCPHLLRESLAKRVAERWVESCRSDLLDHIVAVNGRHLKRLLSEYVRYYHEDRTHLGLGKGTPNNRPRSIASGRVLSHERLGGLYHRYDRAA